MRDDGVVGAGERVAAQLVWIDSTGQEHKVAAESPRQPTGMFVAPKDYQAGRIVWTNTSGWGLAGLTLGILVGFLGVYYLVVPLFPKVKATGP